MAKKFEAPEQVAAGYYFGKEERKELIASGTPLQVVRVSQATDTYQGRTRPVYNVTFLLDGDERGWSFGIGSQSGAETSRDRFLGALAAHLEDEDPEDVFVIVTKVGAFYNLEVAEEAK